MAYSETLADRVREYLVTVPGLDVEEKKMFSGLAFMVNGKMCINVIGEELMCRFDHHLQEEVVEKRGYMPMIMKGKELKGYCLVAPEGYASDEGFRYWLDLCLAFNSKAKPSKKKKAS